MFLMLDKGCPAIQKLRYVAEWNLFRSTDNILDSLPYRILLIEILFYTHCRRTYRPAWLTQCQIKYLFIITTYLLIHSPPCFLYLCLTAAHAALWATSSALWLLPPLLFAGFWYSFTALACAFLKICWACSGNESICFFVVVDSAVSTDFFLTFEFFF